MSNQRIYSKEENIMAALAANKAGTAFKCKDYKTLVVTINTPVLTDGTIKAQMSISETAPLWDSAASPTNRWSNPQMVDLDTGSTINGSTGVTPAGAINKSYEIATNGASWLNFIVSGRAAGSYTVNVVGYN